MRGVMRSLRPQSKPHWYRRYIGECPVCGHDKSYKERVYGPPPVNPTDRRVYIPDSQTYDHCLG